MPTPWIESLRRAATATLPTADRSIGASDRRHVWFVAPRYAKAIVRDADGLIVVCTRLGDFLAGPLAATNFVPGALVASDFLAGAVVASGAAD